MVPGPKSLMNSKELLVVGIIVELQSREHPGIVGNRPDLLIRTTNGENASNSIVGGVYLHNDQSVWNQMGEDRSRSKGVFEVPEGRAIEATEVLGNTFVGEVYISDRVVRTKVCLEFQDKLLVVLHLEWTELGIIHEEEVWFEPLQSDTLEVGLYKGDLGTVLSEYLRAILKVQLVLHQENPEFAGISPVKLVWFSDFCVLRGFRGVAMQGLG